MLNNLTMRTSDSIHQKYIKSVVESLKGHMYKASKAEIVMSNIVKADRLDKAINIVTGRFVSRNSNQNYYYNHDCTLAIPKSMLDNGKHARDVFIEYKRQYIVNKL